MASPTDEGIARIVAAIDSAQPPQMPAGATNDSADTPKAKRRGRPKKSATPDKDSEPCDPGMGGDSSRDVPSLTGSNDGPPGARAFGFSVEQLNEEFALVLMGSKAVVFFEQPKAAIEDQKRVLSLEAFAAWFANRFTEVAGDDGKVRRLTWAKAWLQSKSRRSYRGIEFYPDPNNAPGTPGYLNLWSGFAVAPARERDPLKYKTFRDHLANNVCRGDPVLFDWVFGFFAHMVQRPRERVGTALVMRGRMGTGKTKVGEVIGSLIPRHFFLVDDPRYVTGQFNAHMATCLLLQADEAVWAGDKAVEGRLKGLITSAIQQIEAKGVDPIRLANYVRVIMTSNEDWVVPAGKDERRFCVLDVDPRCAQNIEYFAEMDEELEVAGREALLADLLAFDLSTVDLRHIPKTAALLEQKIRSFDSVDSWWFERLWTGTITRNAHEWKNIVSCKTLFEDYLKGAEEIGIKRKQEQTVLGIKLKKLVPTIRRVRRDLDFEQIRTWCYELPALQIAREMFESLLGQSVDWPDDDDKGTPPPSPSELDRYG